MLALNLIRRNKWDFDLCENICVKTVIKVRKKCREIAKRKKTKNKNINLSILNVHGLRA